MGGKKENTVPAEKSYLDVQLIDISKKVFNAVLAFAAVQQHEFDVSRSQKRRYLLVVDLGQDIVLWRR